MWRGDYFTTSAGARRMGLSGPRNGRIYIMYHGTSWWAAQKIMAKDFCPSNRDLEKASRYPLDLTEHQKVVIKVKVNVGKVKKIDRQDHPLQKTWHDEGYDSAWVPPNCGMVKSGLEETCVWDPNRITVLDIIKSKTEPTLQMCFRCPGTHPVWLPGKLACWEIDVHPHLYPISNLHTCPDHHLSPSKALT
uniref:Grass carp reovirus (GCRV)-induced gene 2p n=1 Tax=Oncorhynchus kisutch TaxID=8019 RepID=A0A8C7CKI5_ONCKI